MTPVDAIPVGPDEPGFGVYLHWPFCAAKCPYCDFNSHVRHAPVDEERFVRAFSAAIAHQAGLAPGRVVTSIFLGGGTPSLMQPRTVAALLDAVAKHWAMARDVEVTLEANPTSIEAERLAGYRASGVNRLSMGVQAMNDRDLKNLGRMHSADEALAAVAIAARIFDRYSFDLIYARPQQTPGDWARELEEAIGHAAEHLSLYQLTIEPGTVFERLHQSGRLAIPSADEARRLYEVTQEVCDKHGLPAYEISNHARPGAESRHNLVYWRYGEYAGVGPGAHARLVTAKGRVALVSEPHPETWCDKMEQQGHAIIDDELLGGEAQGDEMLLMGLRLREGISRERYHAMSGRDLSSDRIDALIGDGLIERVGNSRLRATPSGVPVLDAIVADLAS
jgi:putative oxygen-independent coproporphyrinogen III oxidase